jgi:hypothetical protein
MAFYSLEPWGEQRGDLRTGILASVVANMFRKKGRRALQPRDFMPKFDKPRKMSPDEVSNKLKSIVAAHQQMFGGER